MSISSSKTTNPAKRFIEWQGGEGFFYYYDKEKQEKVKLPKKFQIIALDELATIKGFDERANSGIYSNEVRDTTKDTLTVKNFKGDQIAEGIYQSIKGDIISAGGKYCKSIYGVMVDKKGVGDLVQISIKGSALGPFIDASIRIDDGCVITFGVNPEEKKKGKTVYYEPTYEAKVLPEGDYRESAISINDTILQP